MQNGLGHPSDGRAEAGDQEPLGTYLFNSYTRRGNYGPSQQFNCGAAGSPLRSESFKCIVAAKRGVFIHKYALYVASMHQELLGIAVQKCIRNLAATEVELQ